MRVLGGATNPGPRTAVDGFSAALGRMFMRVDAVHMVILQGTRPRWHDAMGQVAAA